MHKPTLAFISALVFCASARAEAALADLTFMMPQLILVGLYEELSRPWVLGALWGITALSWAVYFVTGRDVVGDVMVRLSGSRNSRSDGTSPIGTTALAIAVSLYVVLGYALSGPLSQGKPGQHRAGTKGTAQTAAAASLPYPYGKSAANPQGQWPATTGPLPGQSIGVYGGGGYVMLRNTGDEALWARMCAAEDERCTPLRDVYLAPRSAYLLERITEGRYRVAYTQITGGKLSGMSPVIRPDQKSTSGETLVLDDFQPKG